MYCISQLMSNVTSTLLQLPRMVLYLVAFCARLLKAKWNQTFPFTMWRTINRTDALQRKFLSPHLLSRNLESNIIVVLNIEHWSGCELFKKYASYILVAGALLGGCETANNTTQWLFPQLIDTVNWLRIMIAIWNHTPP